MGEPEEDKDNAPFNTILIVALAAGIFFVVATMIVPLIPTGSDHPPQVIIWRESPPTIFSTDRIHVKYIGGTDDGFVGNFRIVVSNGIGTGGARDIAFTRDYPKPEVYSDVAVFDVPPGDIACVNVSAIDLAVHAYRPIGYNCT
jgi:hypothetical protein